MEKPDHIPNAIAYAIVLISIGYYGGRLIYVLLSSTTHITKLHWRVRLLIVMVVITFCCFLIRFFWTIFDAFDLNVVQDAINDLVSDCRDECKWFLFLSFLPHPKFSLSGTSITGSILHTISLLRPFLRSLCW